MMGDKIRESRGDFRREKRQESDGGSGGAIGKSMAGKMHSFETDAYYKHKIEFPFEEFDPIPLDDDDFLDGLYYEESEYYDFDKYGFDDDY